MTVLCRVEHSHYIARREQHSYYKTPFWGTITFLIVSTAQNFHYFPKILWYKEFSSLDHFLQIVMIFYIWIM